MRRLALICSLLPLAFACVTPHSAVFGLTPGQLGAGNAELALSPGVFFQAVNDPPTPAGGGTDTLSTRNLGAPVFEGNAQLGLTDGLGLNLHLSPAGLQPGVKISLPQLREGFTLAVLPELALGAGSQGSGVTRARPTGTTVVDRGGTARLLLMGGFKVLAAHSSGAYAGLGYDFQRLSTEVLNGGTRQQGSVVTTHTIGLAVGYELTVGGFFLRPELAVGLTPSVNTWNVSGTAVAFTGGGSEVLVFPNITVALRSGSGPPAGPPPPPPEGMRPEELSLPPVFPAPP